jgi:hypothetical protein
MTAASTSTMKQKSTTTASDEIPEVGEESKGVSPTEKDYSKLSARERRQRKRDDLRSKSIGVGLRISEDTVPINKKIVFDDDQIEMQLVDASKQDEDAEHAEENADGDSDDDAVEEVKSSVAKMHDQEQRSRERTTALESDALKSNKRKRKNRLDKKKEEKAAVEEEFDENFFEKLDAEMGEERKNRKKKKNEGDSPLPKGRHTTFVAKDEAFETGAPVNAGHNIEVVVLKDDPATEVTSIPASKAALLFSRSQIVNGSDIVSEKQLRKAKKSGRNVTDYTSTWNRSKKMNRLLLPGAKSKRRSGEGAPASHFVVKL